MSDPLESMLQSLGPAAASRPPEAFIRAVAGRRLQRRLRQAGAVAAVLCAAGAIWIALPKGRPPGEIARGPAYTLNEASLAVLARTNTGLDPDDLRLPEPDGSGPPPVIRPSTDPDRLEAFLAR